MIDETTIEERMKVLDEDIQKVNEQLVELEKKKQQAASILNALSGARQQCAFFLEQDDNGGQASGQSDVSQGDEDAATTLAFNS